MTIQKKIQVFLAKVNATPAFEFTIISIILLASLSIGIKTYDVSPHFLKLLHTLDVTITVIFLIEIILRFMAEEHKGQFFRKTWNVFDTLIVLLSLLPIDENEFVFLARLIRIFRVLRLVSFVPELRILVSALLKALPSMTYVLLLMFILFYIYAAVGSILFHKIDPILWGDIAIAMLTLFRVITFEDWTDVMYETMVIYPWSWLYYLSFIFFNAFVFLNMMIGIVIEKMQDEHRLFNQEKQGLLFETEEAEQTRLILVMSQRLGDIEKILRKGSEGNNTADTPEESMPVDKHAGIYEEAKSHSHLGKATKTVKTTQQQATEEQT